MQGSLDNLKKEVQEFSGLQKELHSGKLIIPKDYFWNRKCFDLIDTLTKRIESDISEMKSSPYNSQLYKIGSKVDRITRLISQNNDMIRKNLSSKNMERFSSDVLEINRNLTLLDSSLIDLVKRFNLIGGSGSSDPGIEKLKYLAYKLDLNIFRFPGIADILTKNWHLAKIIKGYLDDRRQNRFGIGGSFWQGLMIFEDAFLLDSSQKAEELRKEALKDFSANEIDLKNPYFLDNLKKFQHEVAGKILELEKNLREQNIINLGYAIHIAGTVLAGTTLGSHERDTTQEYLPALRRLIRDKEDLKEISKACIRLYHKSVVAPCKIIAETLPHFKGLYHISRENFLAQLENPEGSDIIDYYSILAELQRYVSHINTIEDFSRWKHALMQIKAKNHRGDFYDFYWTEKIITKFNGAIRSDDLLLKAEIYLKFLDLLNKNGKDNFNSVVEEFGEMLENADYFELISQIYSKNRKDIIQKIADKLNRSGFSEIIFPIKDILTIKDYLTRHPESWEKGMDFLNLIKDAWSYIHVFGFEKFSQYFERLDSKGLMRYVKNLEHIDFHSVQGLKKRGFLCVHVTNGYSQAAKLKGDDRYLDPFQNIINDLVNQGVNRYQLSMSTISQEKNIRIARTGASGIKGSIGIVLDSGYIYEAYFSDVATGYRKRKGDSTGGRAVNYKTAHRSGEKQAGGLNTMLVVNLPESKTPAYNELLVRKWTVGAFFYTKGVQEEVIQKLIEISRNYSGREYINPGYINRKIKLGIPKMIAKDYPVLEIDISKNTWRVAYDPKSDKMRYAA